MTYIPNCREDENYNEKYLNKKDKEFLAGFDWCMESAVDNFFDNNYKAGFDEGDFVGHEVLQELPEVEKDSYVMEFNFGERKAEERKIETIIDKIRYEILAWIECERDMLITSMIDAMDEEEYHNIKSEVDKENENV